MWAIPYRTSAPLLARDFRVLSDAAISLPNVETCSPAMLSNKGELTQLSPGEQIFP